MLLVKHVSLGFRPRLPSLSTADGLQRIHCQTETFKKRKKSFIDIFAKSRREKMPPTALPYKRPFFQYTISHQEAEVRHARLKCKTKVCLCAPEADAKRTTTSYRS